MPVAMTSRQRLFGALRHEAIDRVPISTYEMVGYNPDGYWNREPSYARLARLIREKTDCIYMYSVPFLYRIHPRIRVEKEQREAAEGTETRTTIHTPRGPLTSRTLVKPNLFTTWTIEHLLKDEEDVRLYQSIEWVRCRRPDYDAFHAMDRRLGEHGIPGPDLGDAFCHVASLFSFEDYTLMAYCRTDLLRELVVARHAQVMESLKAALEAGWYGLFRIYGSEYGAEPYVPPRVWDALEKPFLAEMCALIRSYPNAYPRIHSHGRYRAILPSIMACNPAALEPCEPPPDGDMTLADLKAEIGERVCLMGAMELKMLETATPEEVRAEVRRSMEMAKGRSGYIALTTASPISVPLARRTEENYFAWIEANLEYGRYERQLHSRGSQTPRRRGQSARGQVRTMRRSRPAS